MKIVAYTILSLLILGCGIRPAQVSPLQTYRSSADGHAADGDDCKDEMSGDKAENEADAGKKDDDAGQDKDKPGSDGMTGGVVDEPAKTPDPKPVDPEPMVDARLEKIRSMLAAKRLVSEYTVTDTKSWGTSKDKRIEILVAVDDKGMAIVPSGINNPELEGSLDSSKDPSFKTTSLHSTLKICNQANADIRLHAEGGLPFGHGMDNIRKGSCTIYLLKNANSVADGKSWDHIIGSQLPVYFKVVKIKPDGSEVP